MHTLCMCKSMYTQITPHTYTFVKGLHTYTNSTNPNIRRGFPTWNESVISPRVCNLIMYIIYIRYYILVVQKRQTTFLKIICHNAKIKMALKGRFCQNRVFENVTFNVSICARFKQKQRLGCTQFKVEVCNLLRHWWGRVYTSALNYVHPSRCFCLNRE